MSTELLLQTERLPSPETGPKADSAPAPLLVLRQLSRWYSNEGRRIDVLEDVSFSLAPGETMALFGPSGSGKSTLLNLIALLDRPDRGEIRFAGEKIDGLSRQDAERFRARHVGIVFQSFNLIPTLSALENVEIALLPLEKSAAKRRERACAILERVGLGDRLKHRPAQLSGGQQQRVGVARALCKRPALVLADEPSANLDSRSAQALFALMRELAAECGTAFLIATHDQRLLQEADRSLELIDGRLTL